MKIYILAFLVAGLLLSTGCLGDQSKSNALNASETTGQSASALKTKESCEASHGHWGVDLRTCAKAKAEGRLCAPDPSLMVCQCSKVAGFSCPSGFTCGDYVPSEGALDAFGVCLRAS